MTLRIRAGVAADWPACAGMDVSYSTEDVWQLQSQPTGDGLEIAFTRVRLPRPITLRDPYWGDAATLNGQADGALLVAESDGGLTGFCLLVAESAGGMDAMPMLAVAGRARRQGVGRQLIEAAMAEARRRGRRAVRATLQARNYPAIRFLTSAGFAFAGYDEQHYPSNDVAVIFAQRLRPA